MRRPAFLCHGALALVLLVLSTIAQTAPAGAASGQSVGVISERHPDQDRALLQEVTEHVNRFRKPAERVSVHHVRQPGMTAGDVAELRRKLTQARHSALFARSMNTARIAQQADPRTPIVFDGQGDPVLSCLVDSDVRPGRNVTGFTSYVPYQVKMAETLLQAFPATAHVVVLDADTQSADDMCTGTIKPRHWPPRGPHGCGAPQLQSEVPAAPTNDMVDVQRYLHERRIRVSFLHLCDEASARSVAAALAPAVAAGPTAVIVPLYSLLFRQSKTLVRAFDGLRVPAIYTRRKFLDDGGLLALTPIEEMPERRRSLELLDQVLDGADPALTPVRRPTGFMTVLNVGAAQRNGLKPSAAFLRRTDAFMRP